MTMLRKLIASILVVPILFPFLSASTFAQTNLAAVTPCDADINSDRYVDISDYTILVSDFFKTTPINPRSNIIKDGFVDILDYSALVSQYFQACKTSSSSTSSTNSSSSSSSASTSVSSSSSSSATSTAQNGSGSFSTGVYKNFFKDIGKTDAEIQAKVDAVWNQFFYGDNNTQRLYYPVGTDMAYIHDVGNGAVVSEGMSYGMMIAVQMNKKAEFDRLWKWAVTYMQHQSGARAGYFAWKLGTDGSKWDQNPASDGEAYFVTALMFASKRWGDGTGIFNYKAEAQKILDVMLHKEDVQNFEGITNMFDKTHKQVVFTPIGTAALLTDPSYHLPSFYELWARFANKDNQFWSDAAIASRDLWQKNAHPTTGLPTNFANFDGTPSYFSDYGPKFTFDAWRVGMNVGMDYNWFKKDERQISFANKLLTFFTAQNSIPDKPNGYGNQYQHDGTRLGDDHSPGLVATNAVLATISTNTNKNNFITELWNLPVPSGQWRYYDGMLYMMSLLHVSGNFKAYL